MIQTTVMFHIMILIVLYITIILSGLVRQQPGTYLVYASEIYPYGSGYSRGCSDAKMAGVEGGFVNESQRSPSFQTDEFKKGYEDGFSACFGGQQIEILGWKIKAESSIGDLVAIVALIASAFTFWFGYVRTRKSEQIKTARELYDTISSDYDKTLYQTHSEYDKLDSDKKEEWMVKTITECTAVQRKIRYFSYLIESQKIENNVVGYYRNYILGYLKGLDELYTSVKTDPIGQKVMESYPKYHEQIGTLKMMWNHKKISKLKALFRIKGNLDS